MTDEAYPKLVASRPVHQGRTIQVRVDEIEVREGLVVRRDIVAHPGAVVMLAVDAEDRILWITQHRWAVRRVLLELPAGTLEHGEAPEDCAPRELAEETGFAAAKWQALGGFYSAPGFCDEYLYAFLATDLTPQHADGDEDEDITVVPLTLEETLARLDAGDIVDAKSISTLLLYLRARAQ